MSSDELQEILDFQPFTPMWLTLSSGNVVELHARRGLNVNGLTLSIEDRRLSGHPRLQFVSVPNIALLEFIEGRRQDRLTEGRQQ